MTIKEEIEELNQEIFVRQVRIEELKKECGHKSKRKEYISTLYYEIICDDCGCWLILNPFSGEHT